MYNKNLFNPKVNAHIFCIHIFCCFSFSPKAKNITSSNTLSTRALPLLTLQSLWDILRSVGRVKPFLAAHAMQRVEIKESQQTTKDIPPQKSLATGQFTYLTLHNTRFPHLHFQSSDVVPLERIAVKRPNTPQGHDHMWHSNLYKRCYLSQKSYSNAKSTKITQEIIQKVPVNWLEVGEKRIILGWFNRRAYRWSINTPTDESVISRTP